MKNVRFQPVSNFLEQANKAFGKQKVRIKQLLPLADVQHVGSTSIPKAITKGDLDVVVRVPKEEFKKAIGLLKSIYEINQPKNWSDTFASFKDDRNLAIDFGAQLVVTGSKSDDFIKMRDIMIEHPELVAELNKIKMKYDGKSMKDYRKEKANFFQKLREKFL